MAYSAAFGRAGSDSKLVFGDYRIHRLIPTADFLTGQAVADGLHTKLRTVFPYVVHFLTTSWGSSVNSYLSF